MAQLSALTTIRSWLLSPGPSPARSVSPGIRRAAPGLTLVSRGPGEFRESEWGDRPAGWCPPQDRANTAAGLHSLLAPVCLSWRHGGPTRTSALTRPLSPVTPLVGPSPGPGPTLCPDLCPRPGLDTAGSPNSLQSYNSDHHRITRHWSFLSLYIYLKSKHIITTLLLLVVSAVFIISSLISPA